MGVVVVAGAEATVALALAACARLREDATVLAPAGLAFAIPDGVRVRRLVPGDDDRTAAARAGRAVAAHLDVPAPPRDLLLVSDETAGALGRLPALADAARELPRRALAFPDPALAAGHEPRRSAPLFGSFYAADALRRVGLWDPIEADAQVAQRRWLERARDLGWRAYALPGGAGDPAAPAEHPVDPPGVNDRPRPAASPPASTLTVALGHLQPDEEGDGDGFRALSLRARLWLAQDEGCPVRIHDLGSPARLVPGLLALEGPRVEAHLHRFGAAVPLAEREAAVLDCMLASCRTDRLLASFGHAFPLAPTVARELVGRLGPAAPVVACRLPGDGDLPSPRLVGLHLPSLRSCRPVWDARGLARSPADGPARSAAVALRDFLRIAGIRVAWAGEEPPARRAVTPHYDAVLDPHADRPAADPARPAFRRQLAEATLAAEGRLRRWAA